MPISNWDLMGQKDDETLKNTTYIDMIVNSPYNSPITLSNVCSGKKNTQ